MKISAVRYHDISCGHRVVGHESKCRYLHGHNYRITFHCEADKLDHVGRVLDFSVIKQQLCMWLENQWDHKFLVWRGDPLLQSLREITMVGSDAQDSLCIVEFNPTAENMADYLLTIVAPAQLACTGVRCTRVVVEETRKCSAEAHLED